MADSYLYQFACLGRNVDDCFTLATLGRFLETDEDFNLSVNYCLSIIRLQKHICLHLQPNQLMLEIQQLNLDLIKFNTINCYLELTSVNLVIILEYFKLELSRYPVYLLLIAPIGLLLINRVINCLELLLVKNTLEITKNSVKLELIRVKCQ